MLRLLIAASAALLASDSNPQPSDPKEWNPSDRGGWDAGSLPGDLKTRYAHLARFARNIPGTQDEPLGFASLASAARVMDDNPNLTPIDLRDLKREKS